MRGTASDPENLSSTGVDTELHHRGAISVSDRRIESCQATPVSATLYHTPPPMGVHAPGVDSEPVADPIVDPEGPVGTPLCSLGPKGRQSELGAKKYYALLHRTEYWQSLQDPERWVCQSGP